MKLTRLAVPAALVCVWLVAAPGGTRAAGPTVLTGTIGAASYKIEVPEGWNGTLLLYSHGYVAPGTMNEARDASDSLTASWLLARGYALAGSSYSITGYAVQAALQDQIALLDYFAAHVRQPARTIAWGSSLGGLITGGLIQSFPSRFAGALPLCGVMAGGAALGNVGLDASFAFKTLIAPHSGLQLVHITDPGSNLDQGETLLSAAQATAQGRARTALVAALLDIPGWYDPSTPEPAASDLAALERNQAHWLSSVVFPLDLSFRVQIERLAGGNVSWNTGINYAAQLQASRDADVVARLYREAGLNLEEDLRALNSAPRLSADPGAVQYMARYVALNGDLRVPVVTMHTTGDGYVPVENEQSYARVVRDSGKSTLLRELFVHRAGHCTFTAAETIAAFQTLVHRLDTGQWGTTDPTSMNAAAAALGPELNLGLEGGTAAAPAFTSYSPLPFLRPFDARTPEAVSTLPVVSASVGSGSVSALRVSFSSSTPGQGEVLFGSGPGCAGLVGVATRDLSPASTSHTVVVAGSDLPGATGDIGLIPGATYWYEVLAVTPTGVQIDDDEGRCYSVTVPPAGPALTLPWPILMA